MKMKFTKPGIIFLSLLLVACQMPTGPIATAPITDLPASQPLLEWPTKTQTLTIEASSSDLHILVYKEGRLARLGHNHVISVHNLRGSINLEPQISDSSVQIILPVDSFVVDEELLRVYYGDDFNTRLTSTQKAGTRENMLGPRLLDVDRFPFIEIRSTGITGKLPDLVFDLAVTVKDVTITIPVPVNMLVKDNRIHARGQFFLDQSAFNIKPFSILNGAIAVKDRLTVNFSLVTDQP